MSDIFYAYVKSDELITTNAHLFTDDFGLRFPAGSLLTREFLPKRHGFKRVKINFTDCPNWNTDELRCIRSRYPDDTSSFMLKQTAEIWCGRTEGKDQGVVILDRMHLTLTDWYQPFTWIPLRKVTLSVSYATLHEELYNDNAILEAVKLDHTVERVGDYSFQNCLSLKKVVMNESTFLKGANSCFCNCPELSVFIIVPDADSRLTAAAYPDCSLHQEQYKLWWFKNCPKLSRLIIADTPYRIPIRHGLL